MQLVPVNCSSVFRQPPSRVPSWANQNRKEVENMKYEKPEIICVDDAAKSIQQMLKNVIAADFTNGTNQPPAYSAHE